MPSHVPPVPPASRNKKGPRRDPQEAQDKKFVKHEHHPNAAEEGQTVNIKQNTANEGYFRGRRNG